MTLTRDHLGFYIKSSVVAGNIHVPRYYDPEIADRLQALSETHFLTKVDDLLGSGTLTVSTGDEIGKMAYGTGDIPFVRTSDISNWEIKAVPKQGVDEQTYAGYAARQDVRAGVFCSSEMEHI